eukprot:g1701.t1
MPLNWKVGHANGFCDMLYDRDGTYIVSCGSEGEIHIMDAKGDVKKTLEGDGTALNTLAMHPKRGIAVGTDEHFVKQYIGTLPDCKFDTNLNRSTAPIRHVSFNPTGLYLAVATDECDIRLVNMSNTKQVIVLKGHEGSVKSVVWDPQGDFLASTSEDGTMKIWRLSDRTVVYNYKGLKIESGAPAQLCRPQWSPDGAFLALPSARAEDVLIFKRNEWVVEYALSGGGHRNGADILAWSPSGDYMLSGGLDNSIVLWDLKQRDSIGKYECEAQPMTLMWSPVANAFSVIDMDGRYAICENAVPSHMSSPCAPAMPKKSEDAATKTDETSTSDVRSPAKRKKTEKTKKDSYKTVVSDDDDDDDDDDEDDGIVMRKRLKKIRDADDSVAALREELGLDPLKDDDESDEEHDQDDSASEDEENEMLKRANERAAQWANLPPPPTRTLQPVIQPGSTPVQNDRRFLVWNSVGSIVSRVEDTFCSLEIDFSDRSKHRAIRMTDHYRFSVAALGDRGVVLGSYGGDDEDADDEKAFDASGRPNRRRKKKKKDEDEDAALRSTIYYRPLESWSHNSDWTAQLPRGEKVDCVAVGSSWVAASTSAGFLRLWRFSGLQDFIVQTPAPIVCLAGHGSHLATVYRTGNPSDSHQHLRYEVFNVPDRKQVCTGTLPMRSGAKLEWLGFSDKGILMAYEDSGRLSGLFNIFGWKWVPLCDTSALDSKRKSNGHHWVIGVSCGQLMTVLCVNGAKHPSALPKPVPCATPLRLPTLQSNTKVGKQEEDWLRLSLENEFGGFEETTNAMKDRIKSDKICLQLLQAACKADRLSRALDAAMRLQLRKSFEIAIKLSQRLGQTSLAERISLLMHARARSDAQESIAEKEIEAAARLDRSLKRKSRSPLSELSYGRARRGADEDNEAEFDPDAPDEGSPTKKKKKASFAKKKSKKKRKSKSSAPKKPTRKEMMYKKYVEDGAGDDDNDEENDNGEVAVEPVLKPAKLSEPTEMGEDTASTIASKTETPTTAVRSKVGTPEKKKSRRSAVNPFVRKTFASPKKASGDIFEAVKKSPLKVPVLSRHSIIWCDSGFGRILTEMLSKEGRYTVFAGVFLEKSMQELGALRNVVPLRLDVTDEGSVDRVAREIASYLGPGRGLDGLVNNAGILVTPGPIEWTPISAYRKMLDVNVVGVAAVTRSVLPLLRKNKGRIVNVASIAGRVGLPTQSAYCASKFAVEGYSEVLRKEMIPWGVTVHVIEPGVFKNTGLYDTWKRGYEENWSNLSEEVKNDYGRDFFRQTWSSMSKALDLPISNTDSSLVPKAMYHALTSASPKYRYRVGKDSKYIITPLTWMGERTQDWALAGRSKNLPKGTPEDGRDVALGRYERSSSLLYGALAALEKNRELYKDEMDTWVDRVCPQSIVPYLKIARVDRPVGTWLLLWPCLWSQILATPAGSPVDPLLSLKFCVGAFIMRGAGCTVNDLWDRDIDKKVARTKERPLAAGTISVPQALAFLGTQLAAGLGILCTFNTYSIALASSSLLLVGTYPLAKRYMSCPQAVLGLTFNWGALVGWAAVRGEIAAESAPVVLSLYTGCFFWTMLYDTLYAHQDKTDDVKVGINSSALWIGERDAKTWLAGFGGLSCLGFGLSGLAVGAHWPFYAGVASAAAHMMWQIHSAKLDDRKNLAARFKSNSQVGALMFVGALTDHLLF